MDTTPYPKLVCGIAVGPSRMGNYNGTVGAIVTHNDTQRRMILSNYHVLVADNNAQPGDQIGQPASGQVVARLSEIYFLTPFVDAALAVIDIPDNASCEIHEIGHIAGVAQGTIGTHVNKRGIGSGRTSGSIVATDQRAPAGYERISPEAWPLQGQFKIQADSPGTAFSLAGDSGSCIVDDNLRVVGLLVGGSGNDSYATPIQTVIDNLGITICP